MKTALSAVTSPPIRTWGVEMSDAPRLTVRTMKERSTMSEITDEMREAELNESIRKRSQMSNREGVTS